MPKARKKRTGSLTGHLGLTNDSGHLCFMSEWSKPVGLALLDEKARRQEIGVSSQVFKIGSHS